MKPSGIHRVLTGLFVLAGLFAVNFALPRLMPGDPFLSLSVEDGNVNVAFTDEQISHYRSYYGLDRPLGEQALTYIAGLFRGNLGFSIYYNQKVLDLILARLPWTLGIVISSLLFSVVLGTLGGLLAASARNKLLDSALFTLGTVLSEIPPFLLALMLLFTFSAALGWFPLSGGLTPFRQHAGLAALTADILHHAVLPVLSLALSRAGEFFLLSRASMRTVLSRQYMLTARAKGLKRRRVLFRHALKNALPPVAVRFFMSLGHVLGGAVLVESIYAYPGVGKLMREAVGVRDYTLLQGIFLVVSLLVLAMNALSDIVHRALDPRLSAS